MNGTSFAGVPLFISKNHFLDSPSNYSQFLDIYDETGSHLMNASKNDQTFIQVEPHTGTAFGATVYLQSNYLYQKDDLFSR